LNSFDTFIAFHAVTKYLFSKGDIFTPYCYKFI